ncbi:MAG TPA: hypothetical protein VMF62_19425 [Acetobacteraceae bacterium]|nr:hypothetical protein [Acetobacteraceae bacterium]
MRAHRALAVLLLAACLVAGAGTVRAVAQSNSMLRPAPQSIEYCAGDKAPNQLNFSVVKTSQGKAFFAWGGIASGDTQNFAQALDQAGPVQEVILCSPGGDLDEGLNIGYLVREKKLATRLPSWTYCASACNFIFMGGVIRTVEPGAQFLVHMFANEGGALEQIQEDEEADWTPFGYAQRFPEAIPNYDSDFNNGLNTYLDSHSKQIQSTYNQYRKDNNQPSLTLQDFEALPAVKSAIQDAVLRQMALVQDIKELQQGDAQIAAKIAEFLVKMELSLHFLTAFANTPNDAPHTMTPAELAEYNITNTD